MTPSPNPITAWDFILTLGILASIVTNIVLAIRTNRTQKREVSFSETPASKKEFDLHVAETTRNFIAVRNEMASDRADNQRHASKRSETLFTKMDTTRTELDSKIDEVRRELSEKIDGMESRIIATLKNT
jgi:hypothetical protein